MPKEVIHDPTPVRVSEVLCQCEMHAPAFQVGDIGGRAWIQHDVICNDDCRSILSSMHPVRLVNKDNAEQSTAFAIEVAWGRDTHLQLATINLQYRTHGIEDVQPDLQTILDALGRLGKLSKDELEAKRLQEKAETAAWVLNSMAGGLYVDLDRDRTNKLIKTLKRARDQAFGADE